MDDMRRVDKLEATQNLVDEILIGRSAGSRHERAKSAVRRTSQANAHTRARRTQQCSSLSGCGELII